MPRVGYGIEILFLSSVTFSPEFSNFANGDEMDSQSKKNSVFGDVMDDKPVWYAAMNGVQYAASINHIEYFRGDVGAPDIILCNG